MAGGGSDGQIELEVTETLVPSKKETSAPCNHCGKELNHWVIAERRKEDSETVDGGYTIHFTDTSAMLECRVCGEVRLRRILWNSENEGESITYAPPAMQHKKPSWHKELPSEYRYLADEIYTALDTQGLSLALMGTRALLDVYITRHAGDLNNFPAKLARLHELGALNAKQVEALTIAFDAGSAAAHRGFRPAEANVLTALQIVENIIHSDVLSQRAEELKGVTPTRKR